MADTLTTNYNWVLPEDGASDDTWGVKNNANWSNADAIIKAISTRVSSLESGGLSAGDILTAIKTVDGAGSGLDADLLDGQNGAYYQPAIGYTPARADPGEIKIYAMSSVPAGYLECNGAAVSRVTYAALFAAVGTVHGVGDGSTTFNLPDARGEFIRGWDNGRGVDAARAFGSAQAAALASHTHAGTTDSNGAHTHTTTIPFFTVNPGGNVGLDANQNAGSPQSYVSSSDGAHTHTFTTGATGGTETRPRNLAFLICIKT